MVTVEDLVTSGILCDNEYFYKYKNLINKNLENEPEKHITQSHHILPRYYFYLIGKDVDNSKQNLVNLNYCDHILAHYYLYKSSISESFTEKNAKAVIKMSGCDKSILNEDKLLRSLDVIQETYNIKRNYLAQKEKREKDKSSRRLVKEIRDSKKESVT